jgi:exodeoxyribonuclease VII large subunit
LNRYAQSKVLTDPKAFTDRPYMLLDHLNERLHRSISMRCESYKYQITNSMAKLDALSPLKVLTRGYSFVQNKDGAVVQKVQSLSQKDIIKLRFADGSALCEVQEIEEVKTNE